MSHRTFELAMVAALLVPAWGCAVAVSDDIGEPTGPDDSAESDSAWANEHEGPHSPPPLPPGQGGGPWYECANEKVIFFNGQVVRLIVPCDWAPEPIDGDPPFFAGDFPDDALDDLR